MKQVIFLLFLALAPSALFAQFEDDHTAKPNPPALDEKPGNEVEVYTVVEEMPEFPGGQAALMVYLQKNITYPAGARELGIQGKVFLSFVVDATGKVKDVKVVRGVDPSLDQEALRVVKAMPLWKPGKQSGRPVATMFNLPVNFKLQ